MKIGLFIQSSNQELFVKNTEVLMKHYRKVIEHFGLNVDVRYFTSHDNPQENMMLLKKDSIKVPCDDGNVTEKAYILLWALVNKLPKYDIIIKTNNCTVLNLKQICEFCESEVYDRDKVYCSMINNAPNMTADNHNHWVAAKPFVNYPNGNFVMFSYDKLKLLYAHYKDVSNYMSSCYPKREKEDFDGKLWYGIAEDIVFGRIFNYFGIRIEVIGEFIRMYDTGHFKSNMDYMTTPLDVFGVYCKMGSDYDIRKQYETPFIDFVAKCYEGLFGYDKRDIVVSKSEDK